MNRITERLTELKASGQKALVGYIVCGDPQPQATLPAMLALAEQGVDIIELGVPFSDPMADGPTIQLAHERALEHNISLTDTLAVVAEFRKTNTKTPVVLMGYANPIERMGYEAFAKNASQAGVDGVLTVDLPPEEAVDFNRAIKAVEIENIFLLAPTTKTERAQKIADLAGGFLYYVSLKGVTGAGHLDIDSVASKVAQVRQLTDLPLCVGFGIKDAATAKQVGQVADGVVIGSVLVNVMAEQGSASAEQISTELANVVAPIRSALNELS